MTWPAIVQGVKRSVVGHAYMTLVRKSERKGLWFQDLDGWQAGFQQGRSVGHRASHFLAPGRGNVTSVPRRVSMGPRLGFQQAHLHPHGAKDLELLQESFRLGELGRCRGIRARGAIVETG
jgi:hypothetical protein